MHIEELRKSKRILVIGCSGGGKSTVTRALAEKLQLPAVHLDIFYWKPDWKETPKNEWSAIVSDLVKKDEWIMDGTFSGTFELRFPRADFIIVLDLPRLTCLYGAVTRWLRYSKKNKRIDMANGCDERFDLEFYKYIWNYNQDFLPKVYEAIDKYGFRNSSIVVKSRKELRELLSNI